MRINHETNQNCSKMLEHFETCSPSFWEERNSVESVTCTCVTMLSDQGTLARMRKKGNAYIAVSV